MSNNINNTYYYNDTEYRKRSVAEAEAGFVLASLAAGVIGATLPSFSNPFLKQMKKEHANNDLYRDVFEKAVDLSGLKEKGLRTESVEFGYGEEALYRAKLPISEGDVKAGLNAYYSPQRKVIRLNKNKASISGFHELGHAINHMDSKFGRFLQKLRFSGKGLTASVVSLMSLVAIISRTKPKDAKRNGWDFIQDNCGKIAFAAMLPTVAEEGLASYKGIKMAKKAGLSKDLLKNLKIFYGKALLSYFGWALVTGLSVFASSKITELFTRPKKVNNYSETPSEFSEV